MKNEKNKQRSEVIKPNEYSRIYHMIVSSDFNTNRPNPYRMSRIAEEIDRYLEYKRKHMSGN